MSEQQPYVVVAVEAPLPGALTYLAMESGEVLSRGESVRVPLGARTADGIVIRSQNLAPDPSMKMKSVKERHQERPLIPPPYMDWLEWLSNYYIHPLGQVFESVFPPLSKHSNRQTRKSQVVKEYPQAGLAPKLTDEQNKVLASIQATPGFGVHLLHGVTGSGKTEVYLHLLENVLKRGKQGLVLVPEISLTPQLIDRFSHRFPEQVGVLHSHLTPREKTNQWWSVVDRKRNILIGARSALFCPLEDLGLIILDEEHEPSYKQDEHLKYHARDAAIVLAKMLDIPIILGSATPSLESWNNVTQGKFQLHQMVERVNARALPTIEVVDMRAELVRRKDEPSSLPFWLSDRLYEELNYVFEKNEQAALFLNRRGIAQTAQCRACGFVHECPNCSVSLTVHARSDLVCHYCDFTARLTEICPDCKLSPLEPLGLGTERLEKDMAQLFPKLRIARADRDEVQNREQLEQLISDVEQHRIDLLIGTQMIAKGLDFPKLNLVGLVLADIGFHWPDFRASERSFQLLTQVSGRSGRQSAGRVVIQTYDPEHPSIQHTLKADFAKFASEELLERSELHYPPAWRMAMFRIQSSVKLNAELTAEKLVARAEQLQKQNAVYEKATLILGPAEAPLFKLRNTYRYQVIVKCDTSQHLNAFCRQIMSNNEWTEPRTKVQIDIDPFQML